MIDLIKTIIYNYLKLVKFTYLVKNEIIEKGLEKKKGRFIPADSYHL
jgi:hypothetical protein